MTRQSKNKVKLNKEYKVLGSIPASAIKKIKECFDFPDDAKSIRSNVDNTVKHNSQHLSIIEQQLEKLGLTKESYASFIVENFNQIRLGNVPKSIVLAVKTETTNHIAAVHLYYYKNENFWLVKSVHAERTKDLENMKLIWEK